MALEPTAPELRAHVDKLADLGVLPPPPWWATMKSLGFDKAFEDLGIVSSDWWHKNVTWESLCKNFDKDSKEVKDVVSWGSVEAKDIVRLSDGNCYSRSRLREWADAHPGGLKRLPISQQIPTAQDFELLDLVDIAKWKKQTAQAKSKQQTVPGNSDLAPKFAREKDYESLFLLAAEFARSFLDSDSSLDLQEFRKIVDNFPTEMKDKALKSLYNLHPNLEKKIKDHKLDPNILLWKNGKIRGDKSFAPYLRSTGDVESLLTLAIELGQKLEQTKEKEDFENLQYVVDHFPRDYRTFVANTLNERIPGLFRTILKFSYELTPSVDVLKYVVS